MFYAYVYQELTKVVMLLLDTDLIGVNMKKINLFILSLITLTLTACATDKHASTVNPQKIYEAVSAKYPATANTLIFIEAPEGFIAPRLANCAVEEGVDNADVVAINSALALKTTTVVVAGDDESLTASTMAKALAASKDRISGSKVIVIGAKETQKTLASLAAASGVALEFIDSPL